MNTLFKKIIGFFKDLFSKDERKNPTEFVSEFDLNNSESGKSKKNGITTYFVDKENDVVYLSLKKAVDKLKISTLTDLIDFFNSVYRNRLYPDWCDKVINGSKKELSTSEKLSNRILYKALRAFFGCFGCYINLGADYGYESNLPEMTKGNDWNVVIDWVITKMAYKWTEFMNCHVQSEAVSLIFKFNDGNFQIKKEN